MLVSLAVPGYFTRTAFCYTIPCMDDLKQKALEYHRRPPKGKLAIVPSKPCETQEELSLAYSPGVAYPCLEIKDHPELSYAYTARGNTVAVVTDGTAVLGLGNIGAEASMPVMEGKCMLLQKFAGINGVPLAIKGHRDADDFVHIVASLEANFGAINLEDIKSPECFYIEEQLQKRMGIPVFHDDQHGTAIISLAGIINSLTLVAKKMTDARVVINGAGAAGIACGRLYAAAGIPKDAITLVDSIGVVYKGRTQGMNPYKEEFARATNNRTLEDALGGVDVFVGVSVADVLTAPMIRAMSKKPIIFALANPHTEIMPDRAREYGAYIVATGRSDFGNQINNVLGFPGIFRGALDAGARCITEVMKLAAAYALSSLASEKIPDHIQEQFARIYKEDYARGLFTPSNPLSRDFIIPKPFDPRVVPVVSRAVAEAVLAVNDFENPK